MLVQGIKEIFSEHNDKPYFLISTTILFWIIKYKSDIFKYILEYMFLNRMYTSWTKHFTPIISLFGPRFFLSKQLTLYLEYKTLKSGSKISDCYNEVVISLGFTVFINKSRWRKFKLYAIIQFWIETSLLTGNWTIQSILIKSQFVLYASKCRIFLYNMPIIIMLPFSWNE